MIEDTLRAIFALALTLGLFALGVYAVRRWGPKGMLRLTLSTDRRMSVVESLNLDATRRLVLVRLDGVERVILLGEGREMTNLTPAAHVAIRPETEPC